MSCDRSMLDLHVARFMRHANGNGRRRDRDESQAVGGQFRDVLTLR